MMQGLLDFAKSPAGVGLLSAVAGGLAGARRGAPLNTLGAAGLAGLTGYNAASALQEDQMKRAQAEKVRQAIPTLYTKGEDGSMKFDTIAAAKLGLDPKTIKGYAEIPNAGRAKVARTQEVMGPNGTKQIVQLDDYGNLVGQGLDGYVAPQMVDTGDRKMFVTPAAGQSFQVGMSPAEQAANARGWAGVQARQENNRLLQDANDINRMAQRTQIVQGADGVNYLIDKGTGTATPAMVQGGGAVTSGTLAEANTKNAKNAEKLTTLIQQAREVLPQATASGIGAQVDDLNRYFGKSTKGSQAAAKLGVLGGNMLMMMPRMEGPQSDRDVENYKAMVGKLGDPSIPAEERAAALDAIEALQQQYAPQTGKPAQTKAEKRQVVRTGTSGGRKVVQYSDGSLEYAD